jgi:hypothetical protein
MLAMWQIIAVRCPASTGASNKRWRDQELERNRGAMLSQGELLDRLGGSSTSLAPDSAGRDLWFHRDKSSYRRVALRLSVVRCS